MGPHTTQRVCNMGKAPNELRHFAAHIGKIRFEYMNPTNMTCHSCIKRNPVADPVGPPKGFLECYAASDKLAHKHD